MDWLFNALRDFFEWSFKGIEALGMNFNWFLIFAGSALTVWWMIQMLRHTEKK
jgi:hypothetical protein